MSIDWSKAPEGFPVWVESHYKNDISDWHRQGENCFIDRNGGRWDQWQIDQGEATAHFKPTIWTGEGMPPVGTVCEFAGFNPEETLPTDPRAGDQVTVIAHFMSGSFEVAAFTFYAPPEFKYLQVAQGAYGCFRIIRTPEQISEEARVAELNLMIGAIKDHPGGRHGVDHLTQLKIHEEACINLYEAGWRKQVVE